MDTTQNTHISEFIVSETWLDAFGHVNNARYLEIYEQARWNWLVSAGIDLAEIRRTGIGPVILEVNLSFKRELLARQRIRISSYNAAFQKKIWTVQQQLHILRDDREPELASELKVTAGLFDLKTRKLIEPTPEWEAVVSLAGQSPA